MQNYQIKIVVKKDKVDEFLATLRSLSCDFQSTGDCLSYHIYKSIEKENIFCIIGELESLKSLQDHFHTRAFEVLLGAARTLSKDFKLTLASDVKTGSFELAKSRLSSS